MSTRRHPFLVIFSLMSLLCVQNVPGLFAQTGSEIEIVFDASLSMRDSLGGTTKLDQAKQALTTIANQITPGSMVGFRVFGATPIRGEESCTDSVLAVPLGPFQKDLMISKVLPLQAHGKTALGYSLQQAANDFSEAPDVKKSIILISDGEETCGKDPIAVIQKLKARGIEVKIHAIGFAASEAAKVQLEKLAELTEGSYREAEDVGQLSQSLEEVVQKETLLTIQRGGRESLLAAAAGARIISSSTQTFAQVIDGKEEETAAMYPGQEAVFSFKDNQPVLLDAFAVPIFSVGNYNPGEFKLLGSTESPDAGFFPILNFKVENKVFFGNVYQEFKITPPFALRYLKVVVGPGSIENHSYHTEWRAYGKYLSEKEFAAEVVRAGPREINLLAAENGGQLIAAANMSFQALIDGKSGEVGEAAQIGPPAEAIFGFRGGKTTLIKKFAVPVFETSISNCKTMEFSVSTTGPGGPYTSIGTFETTNLVFAGNPYQDYVLPEPVKAKYVKVTVADTHGSSRCTFPELQVFGTRGE